MESKAIDPVDFREAQHKHWDSAAVGWNEWSEFNDRADRHISERLVELAGVRPGSRVLDIAAGYGEPALTAAREAGPEGRVVATDISAEMLAFGRERAAAAGLGASAGLAASACLGAAAEDFAAPALDAFDIVTVFGGEALSSKRKNQAPAPNTASTTTPARILVRLFISIAIGISPACAVLP